MSWETHSEWVNKLFRALMSDAIPNFSPISLDQLLRADQELFLLLAAEYTGSLKPGAPDTDPPLDQEVKRLMNDPRINVHLTPIQKIEKRSGNPPPNQSNAPTRKLASKLETRVQERHKEWEMQVQIPYLHALSQTRSRGCGVSC